MKNIIRKILFFGCGTLILMSAAIYNGFPLVTSDTGAYLNSAFMWEVARDRPFGYSLFLIISNWRLSLWFTVIFQSLLLFILLNALLDLVLKGRLKASGKFFFTILLAIVCQVTWYTGSLMPDIFSALGALALLLWILDGPLPKWFLGLIILVAITTHNSHLLIFPIVAIIWIILTRYQARVKLKSSVILLGLTLSGWILVPSLHYLVGQQFTINKSSHVFLTGRLLETGTLDGFLKRNCSEGQFELCNYRDQLPNSAITFIWDGNSPLYKTNGWEDPNGEYKKLVTSCLTDPAFLTNFLYQSFFHSLTQMTQTHVGDGFFPNVENSNPYWKVQQFYPQELRTYLSSKQNTSTLRFDISNKRYLFSTLLALLVLVHLFYKRRYQNIATVHRNFLWVTLAFIITNAFVTATFANVLGRLQTRVSWMIILAGLIFLVYYWKDFLGLIKREQE